jgi:hypothetical protein
MKGFGWKGRVVRAAVVPVVGYLVYLVVVMYRAMRGKGIDWK